MDHHRSGPRIPLGLEARVRWKNPAGSYRQVQGKTQNISGNGLFVAMPERVRRNTPITITMILPAQVTTVPLELRCQGRVTRWNQPGERRGIGAIIDDYELRPGHPRV